MMNEEVYTRGIFTSTDWTALLDDEDDGGFTWERVERVDSENSALSTEKIKEMMDS